jgi:diguanylate cyclase (GGDEF)-like protein
LEGACVRIADLGNVIKGRIPGVNDAARRLPSEGPIGTVTRLQPPPRPAPTQAARPAQPPAAPTDRVSFRGIPEQELTPAVREALGGLLQELATLKADRDRLLERARTAEDLADSDSLAPVFNRRAFVRELARVMSFSERYDVSASLVYFDLNGFKQINDRHGHAAGDAILKAVAHTLRANVRESDVVGRVGGDEFAVVLAKADIDLARAKGAQLSEAVRNTAISHAGQTLRVGASFGAYMFEPGDTPEQALARADEAMYADKVGRKVASL